MFSLRESLPMAFFCTMPKSMAKLRPTAQLVNVSTYLKEQLLSVNALPLDLDRARQRVDLHRESVPLWSWDHVCQRSAPQVPADPLPIDDWGTSVRHAGWAEQHGDWSADRSRKALGSLRKSVVQFYQSDEQGAGSLAARAAVCAGVGG